jgi:LuxR family maltose regulon positive regulatory protein
MASRVRQQTEADAGHVPRIPRAYVARERLWAHLDDATEGAVTLLVGPGGAGKTLGVSGWLRQTGRAEAAAWVQADEAWTPGRLLGLLDQPGSGGRDDPPRLMVVDDAHRLPIATVRALDERLDTAPDSFRVLLISRWDLPFTRLASELIGHFTSLRGELLRLDEAESAALVRAHAHTNSVEVARAIAERTQGWCAAVVLTARAVAAAPDPLVVARRYADGDASVADRVASEVFAVLQPRERHLLLCVANEPVVTPALAIHLSHDPRAGEALADLEAMGLLVTRISTGAHEHTDSADERDRYTIHPLLAEVVRRRTAAGGVDVVRAAATVRRAVQLDLARGSTAHAFRRLVDVGHHAEAAQLLADDGPSLLLRGHGGGINAFALGHPSTIEATPGAWFAIAIERWFIDEISCARHWLDRIMADPLPETPTTRLQVACVRLMRSRLGLESMPAAVRHAEEVLARHDRHTADALVPIVLCELAITQNWLGDLPGAEVNLTTAARLSRSRDLPALTAVALSHLAFTEYMRGRESTCIEIADEVLAMIREQPWTARFSGVRVTLARQLAALSDVPWHHVDDVDATPEPPVHAADLTTKFWARMQRSRLQLAHGSVSAAGQALDVPLDTPKLPGHLAVALLLDRALHAGLAADGPTLLLLQRDLEDRAARGEAALVAALRADLGGDRRGALALLSEAAATARYRQPAVRALALATAAQLSDSLGDATVALDLLHQALVATEVRRNAVPFLGWSRHGSQMSELLDRMTHLRPTPWLLEVAAGLADMPGVTTYFGPSTALPRERTELAAGAVRPVLSPRERDVLNELARGSTYADIAANLYVSENTVKTHVSSLYGKLSVNRRSAALAAARSMNLL